MGKDKDDDKAKEVQKEAERQLAEDRKRLEAEAAKAKERLAEIQKRTGGDKRGGNGKK